MSKELKIIAVPDPDWRDNLDRPGGGQRLGNIRDVVIANAAAAGFETIIDYQGVHDLKDRIASLIRAKRSCLHLLEIVAHSSPDRCNDIASDNVYAFVNGNNGLATLTLCDVLAVYLSGCNSGLHGRGAPSIAELVANEMPAYDPGSFPHHVLVFGSGGYLSGLHMTGDEKTSVTSEWSLFAESPPQYPGAREERGNPCWNSFKNKGW